MDWENIINKVESIKSVIKPNQKKKKKNPSTYYKNSNLIDLSLLEILDKEDLEL